MRRSVLAAGVGFAVAALAGMAHAQGSSVMTHGACATAMAVAQVAAPCDDGSAVLFNPAALADQPGVVSIGWTGIQASGAFTFDRTGERIERDATVSSVPFAYATTRVGERVGLGIGVFAPYGLGLDWPACPIASPACEGPNFEGRFASYDSDLRNIYIQPTVAVRAAPWLSLGAGLDVVRSSIGISQRLDLATTPIGQTNPLTGEPILFGELGIPLSTDFADVRLSGDGWGVGYHLGAQIRVSDALAIGARYLSTVEIDYEEGEADFTQVQTGLVLPAGNPLTRPGNPFGLPAGSPLPLDAVLATQFQPGQQLGDQAISTGLTNPDQFVVGVALTPLDRLKVNADYQWTGWEEWEEAALDFETAAAQVLVLDYQNTDTWRIGAEFRASDALALRGGFIYNTAAQREFSVSPLLPEAERNYYTAGLGYRLGSGLQLDLGYQLVDQSDRRGRVRGRLPELTPEQLRALNVGVFEAGAHVFNAGLSYRFGGAR